MYINLNRGSIFLFATVTSALAVSAAFTAQAAPLSAPNLPDSGTTSYITEALPTASDDLFISMSALPGFHSGGQTTDGSGYEFYWHGGLPAVALDLIARAEVHGISVRIVTVKYSESELWGYMRTLATALGEDGIVLSGYGPGSRDNTVVDFMGPELSRSAELQARSRAIADKILPHDIGLRFIPHESPVTF
ncbi:MAG: hypothetical protein RL431_267 [Actinomycetota bacterium]|jgi:hypothetical protein